MKEFRQNYTFAYLCLELFLFCTLYLNCHFNLNGLVYLCDYFDH